ncbi:hypothetical protein Tco_1200423 [Tanacetum coccineum]
MPIKYVKSPATQIFSMVGIPGDTVINHDLSRSFVTVVCESFSVGIFGKLAKVSFIAFFIMIPIGVEMMQYLEMFCLLGGNIPSRGSPWPVLVERYSYGLAGRMVTSREFKRPGAKGVTTGTLVTIETSTYTSFTGNHVIGIVLSGLVAAC